MKTKHTFGPWHQDADQPCYVGDATGTVVSIPGDADAIDSELAKANARLIAAAPEMLQKLYELADVLENGHMTDVDVEATLAESLALIAKITGGSK